MIPLQLTLKNFLSYHETTLDFRGLHLACICGPNGAGKSSLLEAIAWALWGNSRVAAEDDIINATAKEVRVDFIFQNQDSIYRVIRTRTRGNSSTLEFQIASEFNPEQTNNFRPLTEKGIRNTQQVILQHIKLDYDTFINSAYLRQGRADEFMLKKPQERKQILADLLKLSQYDELAEKAKEKSREFKSQVEVIEQNLETIQTQLLTGEFLEEELNILTEKLNQTRQEQENDQKQLSLLQSQQHQRQNWEQQLNFTKQQYEHLEIECRRIEKELNTIKQQQKEIESLLEKSEEITENYANLQHLQAQEEILTAKFQQYQNAKERQQILQQQLSQEINNLQGELRQAQTQVNILGQQEEEIKDILSKRGEIEAGLLQLQQVRDRLNYLDKLQVQVTPLLKRRQQFSNEIDRAQARLSARLEELYNSAKGLQMQQEQNPKLQQKLIEVSGYIAELEKKQVHQQRVREKGLEKRNFIDRLQADHRNYQENIADIERKIEMLQTPDAVCPLCDRSLDEHHWNLVLQKQRIKQQEMINYTWIINEQLAVSDREIKVLRDEYKRLEKELSNYTSAVEKRAQLQAQLNTTADIQYRLQQIVVEVKELENSLHNGDYARNIQEEIQKIDQQLQDLNYNEQDHAVVRGQVDRLRWAEIKQEKIKDASKKQAQIDARRPEILAEIDNLQKQIDYLQKNSPLRKNLDAIEKTIAEIGYNSQQHNNLIKERQTAQIWQIRYQELSRAKTNQPQLLDRGKELSGNLAIRCQDLQAMATQIETLKQQINEMPHFAKEIKTVEEKILARRRIMDEQLGNLGRLQQQQQQLNLLQTELEQKQQQLQEYRRQYRVYQELVQAFGKNGIQALMIENVLPQLEAEANQFLSRLTANQLHIQFVTQKAGKKGRSSAKGASKLIDTLDILIADARGTRAYETYSGGEAFRINFAIRLALAKLLAQRAGTALQMLIVDEGFGTQDQEGCDRLIAAINAIAGDFACILTVTHMPYFKEAFQARIEVIKTVNGSKISLSM